MSYKTKTVVGFALALQKPVDFDAFQKMIVQLGMYWLVVNQPPPPMTGSDTRGSME